MAFDRRQTHFAHRDRNCIAAQVFAESISRAVQPNLDCMETDTENLGDVAVLQTLQFA
jgi:hypothetical protein